ncbi:uncharacterized protein N0V89_010049 [Didymosphaeria variabile]|uniref:Uncharacterized protein n=1 Tax=Didymosphaeria variabile TaxID=1932322 RepID=A0A9W9C7X1_9PLEO|nr:uncharacterized protein N0V89_010049 [Didymosphaeria variabile]KAJ4348671.1 hypothetical protein N0V89_010049 [Didymosphaeria variabile]
MGVLKALAVVGFACTQAVLAVPVQEPQPAADGLTEREFYAGDLAMTEKLLFYTSLPDFMQHWHAQDPADLYWRSDACSHAPDKPFGFNFKDSCRRHDFCYANLYRQNRFTDIAKEYCDGQFLEDLENECSSHEHDEMCRGVAKVYAGTAALFGGDSIGKHNDVKKVWDKFESIQPPTTMVCKDDSEWSSSRRSRKRAIQCREIPIDYSKSTYFPCRGNRGIPCDHIVPDKNYIYEDCDANGRNCIVSLAPSPPQD